MRESDITQFEKCAGRLHALDFPVLIRPAVPYGCPATPELVAWAIEVYVFCFVAHFRQLVESYALLLRHMHWPTTFFVGRGLFELAGHAMLVVQKVRAALKANDFDEALRVLGAASMGNRAMLKSGAKTADGKEWRQPLNVMDDVRAAGALLPGDSRAAREAEAIQMYDHLCEFCHPNMGAFMQYCGFEERGATTLMRLHASPDDQIAVDAARIAVGLGLHAASELLGIYDRHGDIRARLRAACDDFMTRTRNGLDDMGKPPMR
jgi:hypothetical protein